MATNADIELSAVVLPDIDSAKKAGAALRSELSKAIASLPGDIRDATAGYIKSLGAAGTGAGLYQALSNVRTGIKRGIRTFTALDPLTEKQEDAIRAVDEYVKQQATIVKRTYINDPINKQLSERRRKIKVDEATKALGRGLSSDFVDRYMAAEEAGDTKTLAKLQREQKTKAIAARTILSNPTLVTDAKYGAALSVFEAQDEIKDREKQQQDAVKENTKALKTLSVIATNVVATGFKTFAEALPTYWHEAVTRSTFGHLSAEAKRAEIYGGGAGSAIGNVLGGIVGGLIGGIPGAMIGSSVLGSVGSTIGSLSGKFKGERLESVQRSIAQINNRYRAQGIYGGQLSVGYASAVQETGMASSGDVEKMVHNSATLGARMMFGQVGENDMLMYSMMPGYFAAAMAGKTGAELANAFAADLNRLPPQLRVWAAESVGGGSLGMMAYAASPTFGYVQGNAGRLASIDTAIMRAGAGYHVQGGVRGILDRMNEEGAIYGDVSFGLNNSQEGVYLPTGSSAELALGVRASDRVKLPFGLEKRGVLKRIFDEPVYSSAYYKAASRRVSSDDVEDAGMARSTISNARERILQPLTVNVNLGEETIASQQTVNEIQEGTLLTQTLGF